MKTKTPRNQPKQPRRAFSWLASLSAGIGLLFVVSGTASADDGVKTIKSDEFGFSMQVPTAAVVLGAKGKDGWGGLVGTVGPVKFAGLAKLKVKYKPIQIGLYVVEKTKIKIKDWRKVAAGTKQNGFEWYRVYSAVAKNLRYIAVYGVGSKGSYLLLATTPESEYKKNPEAYNAWISTIRVF